MNKVPPTQEDFDQCFADLYEAALEAKQLAEQEGKPFAMIVGEGHLHCPESLAINIMASMIAKDFDIKNLTMEVDDNTLNNLTNLIDGGIKRHTSNPGQIEYMGLDKVYDMLKNNQNILFRYNDPSTGFNNVIAADPLQEQARYERMNSDNPLAWKTNPKRDQAMQNEMVDLDEPFFGVFGSHHFNNLQGCDDTVLQQAYSENTDLAKIGQNNALNDKYEIFYVNGAQSFDFSFLENNPDAKALFEANQAFAENPENAYQVSFKDNFDLGGYNLHQIYSCALNAYVEFGVESGQITTEEQNVLASLRKTHEDHKTWDVEAMQELVATIRCLSQTGNQVGTDELDSLLEEVANDFDKKTAKDIMELNDP